MSSEEVWLVGIAAGITIHAVIRQLPRLWQWLRFQVWWDYRYAAGYRKGLAVGRRIARRGDQDDHS